MIKEILLSASLLTIGCASMFYQPNMNVVAVVSDEATYDELIEYYQDYMDYHFGRDIDVNTTSDGSASKKEDLLMLFDRERQLGFESQVDEFWSRIIEANDLYGVQRSGYFQGFRTDMGKARVLLGEPFEITRFFSGKASNETWYYNDFTQIFFVMNGFEYNMTKTLPSTLEQYF